jgi:hypothetical protein
VRDKVFVQIKTIKMREKRGLRFQGRERSRQKKL